MNYILIPQLWHFGRKRGLGHIFAVLFCQSFGACVTTRALLRTLFVLFDPIEHRVVGFFYFGGSAQMHVTLPLRSVHINIDECLLVWRLS